ncbi:MAG TPA: metallophosphoesterase [Marinilabiliales bacterium]|jgi:hypothetical protein|nr:MAG: hypothetical protein A2W95_18905 [Bacteroidetes bacterium GWA2_40_14]OFX62787.1 MAG: hypothetical protein A2W84_10760 [Bacteroidetes bacterium GWC2_40_13]OFX72128.1 MAG: hypothetical protein A2W96_00095 [Bacteroidetes bacterium GWD2_40_43]OFX92514.1 MAG: hypothetical protein A2W97_10870 [Bacteroidetes bacterium GWE2_40_63]OFY16452.1 MAG: hypothetical protein A2W88_18230 [Bacteroidetes bacterium GWF2_40_13]OFZ27193.1 MAG: hypothetical protein A2437_18795 [Bacteroidetes bacterium RIFOXYC
MKYWALIIFLTIFFGTFLLGSWYVFNRGMQALPQGALRTVFPWIFWGLAATFIVGQFLERGQPFLAGKLVTYVGSFWLVTLWYLFMMILLIDVVRLGNHFTGFIPASWTESFLSGKNLFIGVSVVTLILVIGGHINALIPRIIPVEVPIDKKATAQKEIKVALVTDIHMGFIIGNRRVKRMVKKINEQNPDLVLFGGDLVDHNPLPVIKWEMGRHFKQLNPPLGVYAVTGNHEYIGHPEVSIDYLSQFGIRYLRDTLINVDGVLLLGGREDKDKMRFTGEKRKPIASLVNGADKSLPILLLDHQPVEFDQVAQTGVDLMMSGHTHHGQFWPFSFITQKVYELDWGFLKKGDTHYYVSSGFGSWGPPVRIGSRSEIVIFTIKLN